jgi:very-short-patch-repair endonuclease
MTKTDKFINRSVLLHKDKYDYSLVEYINNKTKIRIICKEHGEFIQLPLNHLCGKGCSRCCGNKKSNNIDFIENSKIKHNDKYDYSLVEYKNNITKVIIVCKEHGEFKQVPSSHLRGQGCPKCYGNQKSNSIDFIKSSNLIHREKYDYSLVKYINNITKVEIICKEHGKFLQSPINHLCGTGCPKCYGNEKSNTDEFIEKSNVIHNDKYDYSLVKYINNKSKVRIICNKHGEFEQTPSSHLSYNGCPKCGNKCGLKENKWLDLLSISDRQVRIGRYIVDGYDTETNTIYEFNGDYWHGNPDKYKKDDINTSCKKSFGELYEKTLQKENKLKELGYNIISIWESNFIKNNYNYND